jgi:hypothetical protein
MANKGKSRDAWAAAMDSVKNSIKEWGDIQADRQKIMASITMNEIQAKQNMFYKQQEKQMLDPLQQQELQNKKLQYQNLQRDTTAYNAQQAGQTQGQGGVMAAPVAGTAPITTPGAFDLGTVERLVPDGSGGFKRERLSFNDKLKADLIAKGDKRTAADNAMLEALGGVKQVDKKKEIEGKILGGRGEEKRIPKAHQL